jgi:hypothetical protein
VVAENERQNGEGVIKEIIMKERTEKEVETQYAKLLMEIKNTRLAKETPQLKQKKNPRKESRLESIYPRSDWP